jgi:hypothetical protein
MQERVRAVEFVLSRCGIEAQPVVKPERARPQTIPPTLGSPSIDSWPYAIVEKGDVEA